MNKMEQSESSGLVVDRLLHCLRRGLSPALSRARSCQAAGNPRSPIIKATTGTLKSMYQDSKSELEDPETTIQPAEAFVTPDLKSLRLQPFTKEVSPGVFYGSPAGKYIKKPQVLRLLHEIRRDLAAEGYSVSRNTIWATFGKQDQAMQFVHSHGSRDIALFVYQDHITGQRRFLATTYKEFWCRYEIMPQEYRHHYEIITEGSPCHLYFDLEFDCKANIGLDGSAIVDSFLLQLVEALHDIYSLKYDPSWVVELDSTTEEKFSRHVIIRMPKAAFKDNSHVGAFVAEFCRRLDKRRHSDEAVNSLYVLKGKSRKDCCSQLFIDQAVYSRNRSFRLPFSSKAGKTSRLLPSGRFRCKDMSEREVVEDSLICRVGPECEKFLTFGSEVAGRGGSVTAGDAADLFTSSRLPKAAKFCISGRSPFPAVDMFIESISCIEGIPGTIRSWFWFSEYSVLVYNIDGNRYCENIGRQHKSNHVMYIVDFRMAGYYQKCHDPDCRDYKSPLRPIPRHSIPSKFPLSTAMESCYATAEAPTTSLRHEEYSAAVFSCLSIGKNKRSLDHVFSEDGIACDEVEDDDDEWWEEVFDMMEHPKSQPNTSINEQCDLTRSPSMDDDWWRLVQQELETQGI